MQKQWQLLWLMQPEKQLYKFDTIVLKKIQPNVIKDDIILILVHKNNTIIILLFQLMVII